MKESWKLPIYFHNARQFDSNLILKAFRKEDGNISVLPNSMESFISFTYEKCEIKDSMQFLPTSLGELAIKLPVNDPYINSILEIALEGFQDNRICT